MLNFDLDDCRSQNIATNKTNRNTVVGLDFMETSTCHNKGVFLVLISAKLVTKLHISHSSITNSSYFGNNTFLGSIFFNLHVPTVEVNVSRLPIVLYSIYKFYFLLVATIVNTICRI